MSIPKPTKSGFRTIVGRGFVAVDKEGRLKLISKVTSKDLQA